MRERAFRDIDPASYAGNAIEVHGGRRVVAVVGIDRYQAWPRLSNAVNDARGARSAFLRMGFEEVTAPLFDEHATSDALRRLVTDDLAQLGKDDSLVLFVAGHGHTVTRTFRDGDSVKTGYIIAADGDLPGGSTTHWLRLDSWLSDVARLEVKHVLVILDTCHSGIALESIIKWRDARVHTESFAALARRRSRRVITSALDGQLAMDSGPVRGHSLFTGCLVEALDGALATDGEFITGTQLGHYLQRRVTSYPSSMQTPDFGSLEEDRRGELVIQIVTTAAQEECAERRNVGLMRDTSGLAADGDLITGAQSGHDVGTSYLTSMQPLGFELTQNIGTEQLRWAEQHAQASAVSSDRAAPDVEAKKRQLYLQVLFVAISALFVLGASVVLYDSMPGDRSDSTVKDSAASKQAEMAEPPTGTDKVDDRAQLAACADLYIQRQWQALADCATTLESLRLADQAKDYHAKARAETANEASDTRIRKELREGRLKEAEQILRSVPKESVYFEQLDELFTGAENADAEEARRKAQAFAARHDCTGLEQFVAEQLADSTVKVAAAARAVQCKSVARGLIDI